MSLGQPLPVLMYHHVSPSPGMISPAVTMTTSPFLSSLEETTRSSPFSSRSSV